MAILTAGSRLRSQADATEPVLVRAPADDLDLRIGGHQAVDLGPEPAAGPAAGLAAVLAAGLAAVLAAEPGAPGLVGNRCTRDEEDLELLVTKAGGSGLSIGGTPRRLRESKPLPVSD